MDMDKTLYQTFIDNIQADGGKRVRVTGIWSDLYQPAQPDGNSINVIAGQGWVEFANVDTM